MLRRRGLADPVFGLGARPLKGGPPFRARRPVPLLRLCQLLTGMHWTVYSTSTWSPGSGTYIGLTKSMAFVCAW